MAVFVVLPDLPFVQEHLERKEPVVRVSGCRQISGSFHSSCLSIFEPKLISNNTLFRILVANDFNLIPVHISNTGSSTII